MSCLNTLHLCSPQAEIPGSHPCFHYVCRSEPSKKVRVTFFESEKPSIVTSPEPSDFIDDLDASGTFGAMTTPGIVSDHAPPYARQAR